MTPETMIPTNVYAEMTPNPRTMKFVADRLLIEGNAVAEFASAAEA
ncbi:MAG: NifU family protein, partial [Cryomorphaceae bacterium]